MITNTKSHNSPSHNISGSLWNRWDLHFHTPASFDYIDKSVTNRAIIDELLARNVRVVAVTDHHVMDVSRIAMLSPGERGTLLLVFYLLIDKGDMPLVIDQPEGNLDNQTVAKILVDCIREARKRRQVFIVTHNPNLAVVCDADQVVYASMDKANGNAITYVSGALENPVMTKHVTDVLEGTRWAFGVRGEKYKVGE
jgi:predicted ATPase